MCLPDQIVLGEYANLEFLDESNIRYRIYIYTYMYIYICIQFYILEFIVSAAKVLSHFPRSIEMESPATPAKGGKLSA